MTEISEAAKRTAFKILKDLDIADDPYSACVTWTAIDIDKVINKATAAKDAEIEKLQRELNYAAQWAADRLNHEFASSQDKDMTPEYMRNYWYNMSMEDKNARTTN